MKATLGTFEHYCTEQHCGGIVLEDHGRVKKMQKVSLTLPSGLIRTFADVAAAQAWAARHDTEIEGA